MKTYSIHTKDKMYTIQADYFIANEIGVTFFTLDKDYKAVGIGFVPTYSLELVRLETDDEKSPAGQNTRNNE